MDSKQEWIRKRRHTEADLLLANEVLDDIAEGIPVQKALRRHPLPYGKGFLAKHTLVAAYRRRIEGGEWDENPRILSAIRMKPIRTLSGVTTITVLTKPSSCPGKCVFCPTEADMPQSYLPDEPGARRGLENLFDPYRQVASRLRALHEVGHPIDKIELLILGGSWSAYSREYRKWFVKRCFEALNEENSEDDPENTSTLEEIHARNAYGKHRNVGLTIETRPDLINRDELIFDRSLGATKYQIGVQSMDDAVLQKNQRGHNVDQTIEAVRLLRAGGFKIVAHWMPNLLGATLESDRLDFLRLWKDGSVNPDELKIYPCQLLKNSELFDYWQAGEYIPYTEQELIDLLVDIKPSVPRYCRINRVIRDIPSNNVVEGNRNTSLRQDVQAEMKSRGTTCQCIRCREVRKETIDPTNLYPHEITYKGAGTQEYFLSFDTPEDGIAGFLRLCLPDENNVLELPDLEQAAIIREVHVYGQSLEVGAEQAGAAQHSGIGTTLIKRAEEIASRNGFHRLAVIAAVGTRYYYQTRGFEMGKLYMVKTLT